MIRAVLFFFLLTWLQADCFGQTLVPCGDDQRRKFPDECKSIDIVHGRLLKAALGRTGSEDVDIGGIRVTVYSPLIPSAEGSKEVKVRAFNSKEKRVLVFQYLYDSGGTELEERRKGEVFGRFIEDVLLLDLKTQAFGRQPRFRVIGHSDLERTTPGKNYDAFGECEKNSILKDANECVALTRAHELARFLKGKTETVGIPKVLVAHSPDFFLKEVNDETGGQLLIAIGAVSAANDLRKRWGLKDRYIAHEVRAREDIQRDIVANLQEMRRRFAPFRAVVVLVD